MNKSMLPIIGICLGVLCVSTTWMWFEFPGNGKRSIVVTIRDGKITEHPYGLFAWEWDSTVVNMPARPIAVTSSVTMITQNPKVRKLTYRVLVSIMDPKTFYHDPNRVVNGAGNITQYDNAENPYVYNAHDFSYSSQAAGATNIMAKIMAHYMNQFNDSYSKELSEYSDPTDMYQNMTFRERLEMYLQERAMKEGLSVAVEGFRIE